MIKLELRSLSSVDINVRLEDWQPERLEDVYLLLGMEIGAQGDEGINVFYVHLATPEGLTAVRKDFLILENRTLVVRNYHFPSILEVILNILEKACRSTFEESCLVLQRYFDWEYEDYQMEAPHNVAGDLE